MNLQSFLLIFPKNERITVLPGIGKKYLFKGPIWTLNDKYILSCLVDGVYRLNQDMLFIVVSGKTMEKNKFLTRENAGRLAYTLNSFSEDENTVNALARILKYEPEQLKKDMCDIYTTVTSVPKFTAE